MSTQETNSNQAVLTPTNSCQRSNVSTEEGDEGALSRIQSTEFSSKGLIEVNEKTFPKKKKSVTIAMKLTVVFVESYKKYNTIAAYPKMKKNQKTQDPDCHCNCSIY